MPVNATRINEMPENSSLARVNQQILACCNEFDRSPEDVKLVAVSKTRSAQQIELIRAQGQQAFGENYMQEALSKIDVLKGAGIEWHFIGHIQSRKAAQIAKNFDWVHTVDRLKVAQKLAAASTEDEPLKILLQVNLQGESSKSGVSPEALMPLVEQVQDLAGLSLSGLMLIPEPMTDFDDQRRVFALAREYLARAQAIAPQMNELSMGMSGDMRAAIAEGATMVRIGTALFGPRS